MLGRPVLPIFLFLCSEGFHYTHSRAKYLFRLGFASVLMSVANMAIMLIFNMDDVVLTNNAFCTMFTAAVAMCGIEKLKKGKFIPAAIILLLPAVTMFLPIIAMLTQDLLLVRIAIMIPSYNGGDGRILAVALCVAMYLVRRFKWAQCVVIALAAAITTGGTLNNLFTTNYEWMMVFAIIPIMLYNGERGKGSKYFFYLFYPAHIYILYFISYFMSR